MAGRGRNLSDLPDNAVEEILCRLSIRDAARTSVLSRCWRRRWLSIPVLDLYGFYCSEIYQIIRLHSGPLRLFKVEELRPDDCASHMQGIEKWKSFDVKCWLTTISLHSASSLSTLGLDMNTLSCDLNLIRRCFPYLTHLELSCRLSVPHQFRGLTSLRGLLLHDIIPDDKEHGLSNLISACPLLERLAVFNQDLPTFSYFYLDINAPNLRQLYLEGLDLYDFTVTSAPLLEFARMFTFTYDNGEDGDNGDGTVDCLLTKVLQGIVTIKELELDHSVLQFLSRGHVPGRIPICFNSLKKVSLCDVNFGHEKPMLVLLCLLRSCPSLLELILGVRYYFFGNEHEADHDVWDSEAQEDVLLFKSLEVVTMTKIMCTRHELGFLKFVLAKAEVLKAVKISFHINFKRTGSIVANLLEFPRVSNQARILLT